jgi:hypothetical protein
MKAQQPLTAKAKAAIVKYVALTEKRHGYISGLVIDYVLKAERMPREKLYTLLDAKGYTWAAKHGLWREKKR